MKELYNSIKGVFKSGGYSFLLLLFVLFFSADSVSIYFLILFGLVQLPLLFARDGSRHIISLLVFSISYALIWFMTGTISSIAILLSICLCPSIFFLYGSKIGKNFDYSKELPIALLLLITIMLFNVYNATIRNVIAVGIVDPTKVTRSALQNAASVASMVLTTESLVADIKEDTPLAPAAPAGGMY